jgi:HAD superfamily hydrolase (TIGR01450 family)
LISVFSNIHNPESKIASRMIADQFDVFLLDLDGVLYLSEEPIPESIAAVQQLLDRGKAVRILTNNPRLPRQALVERFQTDNLSIRPRDIVTSGWAAVRFLVQSGIGRVDVVGSAGAVEACADEGITLTEDAPDAVIVGADRTTTYSDLQRAMDHILGGAKFVGTNPDTSFPTSVGRGLGAGAVIQALEAATGVQATIAGKPEPLMFEIVHATFDSDARLVMIGDNPNTDIQGARRTGIASILLDRSSSAEAGAVPTPDLTLTSLADLFDESLSIKT